jgi:hypothetical protein
MSKPAIARIFLNYTILALLGCQDSRTASQVPNQAGPQKGKAQEKRMPEDIQAVCQTSIDADRVQKYFHIDTHPERSPLRIVDSAGLGQQPSLSKFGAPVVWVTAEQAKKDKTPYLELTKVEVKGDQATVRFRYAAEGISVSNSLRKTAKGWTVENTELSER